PLTQAAPMTVPSAFWTSHSFDMLPSSDARAPLPSAEPLPKNARTTVPSVFVKEQVLPVSDDATVSAPEATESDAVDGAHESVPLSNVLLVAAAQFVVRAALKVPVESSEPFEIEPDAVELGSLKLVPVPLSFANSVL